MTRTLLFAFAAVLGIGLLGFIIFTSSRESLAFPDLRGPEAATTLPLSAPNPTPPTTYYNESSAGIAVLLQDASASWLGIAHGLKSIGVPFRVVHTAAEALQHRVVLVYPSITGANTAPETLRALAQHVQTGNTVIAFSVIGGGMPALFGFESTRERNDLRSINFDPDTLNVAFLADAAEAQIPLSSGNDQGALPGVSYHGLKHPAVATYDDGSAAITHNLFTTADRTGHAYAIGLDFGHFILRAHNARFMQLAGTYVNEYQPKIDTLLRFLAHAYRQGDPDAVELLPTPHNKEFTALLTHDIDYNRSIRNVPAYADFEYSQGVPATYFIQTKYITDYNDTRFFDRSVASILAAIDGQGMEIASHSVAHSNEFSSMPGGDGTETYPDYRPFVLDFDNVTGGSIAGELRISKFLLEAIAPQQIHSFRPGHLSLPETLAEFLQVTDYRFSSSITANMALTHLPYRAKFSRGYRTETAIFEFPITIEDEHGRLGDRLDAAIEVANRIGSHGGLVNVLIHTDILGHKLEFEKGFVSEFKERAWFDTVGNFGNWWAVRDSAIVSTTAIDALTRRVHISIDGSINGLSLRLPTNWRLQSGPADSSQQGNVVVLGEITDQALLQFAIIPSP